eukprot:CAMPEP_0197182992 /NCGR_PEP_ID=MMETSP1423-20130617/7220_1 /TAXON_ID=476441 /ORGANISM="Pseudo-nitzschia heimii, Strain UNC1101" /LENGTH=387 /DNA_ID=CAMNT_0042633513 /DNA_START=74 /DNA_END=1237 /DNA_ORIENTATION=+
MPSVISKLSLILCWCSLALVLTTSRAADATLRGSRNLGIGFVATEAPEEPVEETVPVAPEEPEEAPVASPVAPEEPAEEPTSEVGDLGVVGASDPDLSILVELITLAGVGGLLSTAGPFTVFAPTNAAFEEVIADTDNLEVLDPLVILQLLSYHVVPGTYMASDITDGLTLPTAQGETVEFHVNEDGVFVNEESISAVDIVASNGVVHKIDGVMFPQAILGPETGAPAEADSAPAETESGGSIVDLAAQDPDLSVLVELVNLAGVGGILANQGPLTVFAPTNAAFEEVITDIDNLEVLDSSIILQLLSYHVAPGTYMASDITDGLIIPTVQGETIEFHVNAGGVFVNEESISAVDIPASNGIIHKIDGVMFPQAILGPETDAPADSA